QIDCTGDEEIAGIVYANSVGEFLYTGAVDRSEIRVRIVDTLTTGTQRLASSGWTTLTVRDFTQQTNASSPQLSLQQNTSVPNTAGFDLRVTGMIGSYSSLTVAFDIDTDGTADFTLHPSASGLISASEITDALAARVSYGGLFFVEARISAPAAQVSDPIYVPVLIADGLNAEELSSAQTLLTAYSAAYSGSQSAQTGITQTGSDDPAAGLSIQTTSEPASDASSPSVTDDWKVLAASAFPSIEVPTIIGGIPNLSSDITLAADLSRIARQYDMNLSEAAKTYSLACAEMEDQYNAACQYAWNIYNARYQELLARYQSLLEESWADTGEDARLRSEYNQAIDDASARRAAQLAAANQTYTTTSSALYSDYLDDYMSEHGDCSGSCTIECLDHQLAALRTYNAGLIGAAADRDEALVQIEADYLSAIYDASYAYQAQRAAGEYSWTINHLNAIEAIISEMVSIEQTYEQACESAFSFFCGAGALAQTYLNACAAAYQTAVTQSWAQIQSALAQWSIDPATDSGWAACWQAIVGNHRQADTAAAAAYVSAVSAQASALNTAITAQINAERLYSQTTAAASYAAEQAKLAAELTCQRTAALEKRAYLFSTNERVKEEAYLQISSALNAQVLMTRRYEEYQLANLNNTYQFQRQSVRLGRQLEQGTITQEEYLAGYQSANSAAEDRQSRLIRRYNADKITITERMVLAKHNSA
ncbi:MAG: hypothetical protein IJG83_08650, partial [Thermoguttaceae bacterium]|nr:hypothetical protein [Thermoguttaceae bacterium]